MGSNPTRVTRVSFLKCGTEGYIGHTCDRVRTDVSCRWALSDTRVLFGVF